MRCASSCECANFDRQKGPGQPKLPRKAISRRHLTFIGQVINALLYLTSIRPDKSLTSIEFKLWKTDVVLPLALDTRCFKVV